MLNLERNITMTLLLVFFSCNLLFAQADSNAVAAAKTYLKYIDSLADNDDAQHYVMRVIEEGPASVEIKTVSFSGRKKKAHTTIEKRSGGWSKTSIQNLAGDAIYRIAYHDNLLQNFYLFFYFKDNILVYAKLDYTDNGPGKSFYTREEYYKNEELVFTDESQAAVDRRYKQNINISLYKKAQEYLQDFFKKKQR